MLKSTTLVLRAPPAPIFGWAAVAAVVGLYDAWALYTGRPTLSTGFWATTGWLGRSVRVVWWGVTVHLMLGNRPVIARYITVPQWEQWQAFVSSQHAKAGRHGRVTVPVGPEVIID